MEKERITRIEKFLSHRLRGFSKYEHTLSGLKSAITTDIPFIEIDTRVSKDITIYVYHNPKLGKETSSPNLLISNEDKKLSSIFYQNGEKLMLLEETLKTFTKRKNREQKLCIDIKDYGFEKEHIDLVKKYDLETAIVFISWIPQVLIRICELNNKIPLILSHWNLKKFGLIGKFLTFILKYVVFKLGAFVVIGEKKAVLPLTKFRIGYQHSTILYNIPPILLSILDNNSGGICIHKSVLSKSLIEYCSINNLQLWIFSANNSIEYQKMANIEGVDVIFSDDSTFIQ